MKPCNEHRFVPLYVDDELRDQELADFESHLAACSACRSAVEAQRRFLDDVHAARPLYSAPPELRSRVENILRNMPGQPEPPPWPARFRDIFQRMLAVLPGAGWPALQGAVAMGLLAAILGGLWVVRTGLPRSDPHSAFAAMAVQTHKRYLNGELPLAMRSASPAVISDWFSARVPFGVHLPSYETPSSQPYHYEGARLISYGKDPAAYVAYHTGGKAVSFVALPTSIAPPLRGKRVPMKSLTIYYDNVDGFHVITWSGPKSRLTYALVTDLEHPSQSCIICHAGPGVKDRDLMSTLRWQ